MNKAQAPLEILQDASLKRRFLTGQASLEYFIIFAVIAGLTLLSVSTFLNRTRTSSQDLYSKAVARIIGNTPPSQLSPTTLCKLAPCSTFNDCADASGSCTSGYACSGTCNGLVVPDSCVPTRRHSCTATLITCPAETIFRPDNLNGGVNLRPGQERIFVIDVPAKTPALLFESVGGTNETNATASLTFPDGREFSGNIIGAGWESATFRFRSQNAPYAPNLPDDYMPEGKYLLKIKANSDSEGMAMEVGC